MRTYQVERIGLDGMPECYNMVKATSRIDAFARLEGFERDDLKGVTTTIDGAYLIVSAPQYSAATWRVTVSAR